MATDHHHSGFDQDQFDRYDTFDAPVEGNVDPNRQGLGGEIGRLIDKIRIDNAANKLEKDVSVGEDRALNASGNWAAVPHEQLYSSVHTNNDPTEAYALAREWTDLGNMMAENSRAMDAAIRSTESGWQGAAAEVAREATLKLATWGGDAAQTSQYMGTRIADQGLAAERAKSAMPEPVQFDYEQMLRQGFATGGLPGLALAAQDVQAASAQARSAHEQAVRVMSEMETQSRNVDETTPRFVRPPETADGGTQQMSLMRGDSDGLAPTARQAALASGTLPSGQNAAMPPAGFESGSAFAANAGGGASGGGGTGAAAFGGGAPGGGAVAFAGGPGGGGVPGGFAGGVPGGVPGGSSAQRNAQAYVPPHIPEPQVPDFGTSAAGFTSGNPAGTGGHLNGNSFQGNSFQPGGTGYAGGYVPGGLPGGSNRDSNSSGYAPPKVPGGINPATGQPYTPADVRRGIPSFGGPGGGGMPGGGYGGGGVPGGGAGAGTAGASGYGQRGGAGLPGMGGQGSSVGAFAAEQAAARNAASAAGAARAGAPGSPGMGAPGGMGAGGGRGDDDKEHRNKYATNEKVVEEPGRMVPQVIGEKSAKQLREEQPE